MKRKTNTYVSVKRFHTGKSAFLCAHGSIFFYILLGVALFGALAFAISRGMRGQTSTTLSERNIDLAVSEILSDAQEIELATSRLRQNDVSENDICFENDLFSADNNASYALVSGCSQDTNKLYHRSGGALSFRKALKEWLEKSQSGELGYGEWMFTNVNGVQDIGDSMMSDPDSMELIAFIPHIKKEVCEEINSQLTISSPIPDNGNAFNPRPVNNGFTGAMGQINVEELFGKYAGCFKNNNTWDTYIFYQVLIER